MFAVYPLVPGRWWAGGITAIAFIAIVAVRLVERFGLSITDSRVASGVATLIVTLIGLVFGGTYYWAPWRVLWRWVPSLNTWVFPDLNGIWIGSTISNWPVIAKAQEAALSHRAIERAELDTVPLQEDAIAMQVKASLFSLKILAGLSSTNSESYSITARPRREEASEKVHITYVYRQPVPDHAPSDDPEHMGAADLHTDPDNLSTLEGVYWTRRKWRSGLNTAGRLSLAHLAGWKERDKTLRQYAAEEKAKRSKAK